MSIFLENTSQVLWNLLRNAIKFTAPGGRIVIKTQNGYSATGAAVIECSISDSGIGILPETLPRLFNAFEQGSARVTQQFGGLGLGLSIAHSLVTLHAGSITAVSEGLGKGSTFTVRLPLHTENGSGAQLADAKDEHVFDEPASTGTRNALLPDTARLRLLLVEDNEVSLMVMRRLLQHSCGHLVTVARTAAEARAAVIASSAPFDVIISDMYAHASVTLSLLVFLY